MLQKTLSQDSNCKGNCNCNCLKPEDALNAYREAAKTDSYMFEECNWYEVYGDIPE